jgi:hypothetical protein
VLVKDGDSVLVDSISVGVDEDVLGEPLLGEGGCHDGEMTRMQRIIKTIRNYYIMGGGRSTKRVGMHGGNVIIEKKRKEDPSEETVSRPT